MAMQGTWDIPVTSMWKYGMFFRALKDHPGKPTGAWGKSHKMSWKETACYWSPPIIYAGACLLGVLDVLFVAIVFGIIAYESVGRRLSEKKFMAIASISSLVMLFVIIFFSVSAWTGYETKPGYTFRHLVWKQHYDLSQMIHPIVHNGVIRLQRS